MTASPLEARCSVCLDTGSKSQNIDDFLNCTSCDAAERRMEMQNYVSSLSPHMSNWSKCWAAYNFGMRRPAAPVAAQPAPATETVARFWNAVEARNHEMRPEMPKLPSTPEEAIVFIGGHFQFMDIEGVPEDRRISLTVHDLLSFFQNLADVASEAAQPADPDDMAANYDHSTHDKRMEVLKGLRAAQPVEVAGQVPKAWMRKWYADGEIPAKVKGVWPKKFKFKSVTDGKIFPDDQPLYAAPQPAAQPSDDVARNAEKINKALRTAIINITGPGFQLRLGDLDLVKIYDAAMAKEKV